LNWNRIHQPLRIWNSHQEKLKRNRIDNRNKRPLKIQNWNSCSEKPNQKWIWKQNIDFPFTENQSLKKELVDLNFCSFQNLNSLLYFDLKRKKRIVKFNLLRQNKNWKLRPFWITFCCIFRFWFSESFVKKKFLQNETGRNQEKQQFKGSLRKLIEKIQKLGNEFLSS
jgi:hypothetical protein